MIKINFKFLAGNVFLLLAMMALFTTATKAQDTTAQKQIFKSVDVAPNFPGGLNKFYEFIGKSLRYPRTDLTNGTQGRVYVTFVVEKDGSLTNVKYERAPSRTLGDEAVRVVSASPKWIPGTQKGQTVRVQYTVPVAFTLQGTSSGRDPFARG
ncbi:energy transducer TonB [Mucilaginibacter lacusdianchii]|uniref:energy transducer TonB n=1 Tax=Mucilaginibacter lacusdianchii TaxID=2684211 RepID=UPI00131CE34B|nr:energy transducer TonB [Mucilaginibacter sp. JXJ CY 39]